MYRKILSSSLLATLFLTAFGATISSICANENVVVADEEKSQIGVKIDIAQLLKDETAAAMLAANPDVPPFVKSMKGMSLYVSLPNSMAEMSDPSNVNFYFSLSFTKMGDCEAAFEEMFGNAPTEDVERNGKTYKKIEEAGSPVVYLLQDGNTIKAYSEKYVDSKNNDFATKGLSAALGKAPKSEPFKMAFDIKSVKGLIGELAGLVPQAEAFSQADSLMVVGGGQGKLMSMLSVETADESTAKKVKSTLQTGLALIAATLPAQLPSEDDAPAINEMVSHVMGQLRPKIDGTTVKVVINKPDNYKELRKKIVEEAKNLENDF